MFEELKKRVLEANLMLPKYGLVTFTWGNISEIDREHGVIAIKPSGVEYDEMKADDIVLLDLDGNIIEGSLRPSSDTPTHIELYKKWNDIGGICHTHSMYATSWAQSERAIPCYGTTHADYFYGSVPVTRTLTSDEIGKDYEKNTGLVILECFRNIDPVSMPGVLCANHGPFTWGCDANEALHNAVVLETIARMATLTEMNNPMAKKAPSYLIDKHYERKHGPNAYYGQKK